MAKHFKFSPSAASRQLVCTASAHLDAPGEQHESSYVAEGTKAHAVATDELERRIYPLGCNANPVECDDLEMLSAAKTFGDYCEPIGQAADRWAIETTLQSPIESDRGGTPDFWAMKGDHLTVVDFKYGSGVAVAAERNVQLLDYAVLLVEHFPNLQTFKLVIVQPRTAGDAVDEWDCSRDDVDRHAARRRTAAARRDFVAGDHCRWCPAIATCDHLAAKAFEIAGGEFEVEAAADRWPELLRLKGAITKLLDSIPGRMLDAMRKGKTFAGYKAVKAQPGNREWEHDDETTIKRLGKLKIGKRQACVSKLKSPTQLEKDGFGPQIADLVIRKDRGITLAEVTDKRPAVVFETVAEQFDDLSFLE